MEEIQRSLKINKAAGLHKIPARLLRDTAKELTSSTTFLVNKSLNDGTGPSIVESGARYPFKTDDKLLVENYRTISVLPALSKVMERVVHTQLSIHLDQLGYLYKHQYGFRRGHSTPQAIAQLNDWVLEAMDGRKVTGVLFFRYFEGI